MKKLNERNFTIRLKESASDTEDILDLLIENKHLSEYKLASKEDDLKGIDVWIDKQIPSQFKIRIDGRFDYPVCIKQPFYGNSDERTKIGRDIKSLEDHVANFYYLAVKKSGKYIRVSRCQSEELCEISKATIKEWNEAKTEGYRNVYCSDVFTNEITKKWIDCVDNRQIFYSENKCEIWWKKNPNEKFGKFNLYVPQNILKSNEIVWQSKS